MFSSFMRLSLFLLVCTCLAVGIFRFSYTALLPSTRLAFGWSHEFASWLGSANLLGYLMGAYWALKIAQPKVNYLIIAATVGCLSLLCCAFAEFIPAWYVFWRVLSGISGGLMMILAPSLISQFARPTERFKITVIGFSGIGIGVLCATLFLPYLDRIAISTAWLILFACSACLCCSLPLLARRQFDRQSIQLTSTTTKISNPLPRLYWTLIVVYGCSAFAYVPHSLFWIDYLKLSQLTLFSINLHWICYGIGSALGAWSAYQLSQRFGNLSTLKLLYSAYVLVILTALSPWASLLFLSSLFTGLLNPAVVFLTAYTLLSLYPQDYKRLWAIATISFASVQLIGGLSFSTLQSLGVAYSYQFATASMVLLFGLGYFSYQLSQPRLKDVVDLANMGKD